MEFVITQTKTVRAQTKGCIALLFELLEIAKWDVNYGLQTMDKFLSCPDTSKITRNYKHADFNNHHEGFPHS